MPLNKPAVNEFGLSDNAMEIIRGIYVQFPSIEKVIVYGSRAMGNFREGSDIDMTVIADGDFTESDLHKVYGLFDDSLLPYLVDISDFSKIRNPDLIDHIKRRGKVLYERKSICFLKPYVL